MMSGIFPVVFISIFLPLCQAKSMTWSSRWDKTPSEEKIKFQVVQSYLKKSDVETQVFSSQNNVLETQLLSKASSALV